MEKEKSVKLGFNFTLQPYLLCLSDFFLGLCWSPKTPAEWMSLISNSPSQNFSIKGLDYCFIFCGRYYNLFKKCNKHKWYNSEISFPHHLIKTEIGEVRWFLSNKSLFLGPWAKRALFHRCVNLAAEKLMDLELNLRARYPVQMK